MRAEGTKVSERVFAAMQEVVRCSTCPACVSLPEAILAGWQKLEDPLYPGGVRWQCVGCLTAPAQKG